MLSNAITVKKQRILDRKEFDTENAGKFSLERSAMAENIHVLANICIYFHETAVDLAELSFKPLASRRSRSIQSKFGEYKSYTKVQMAFKHVLHSYILYSRSSMI